MLVADKTALISPYALIDQSTKNTKVVVSALSQIDAFVRIKCVGGTGDVIIGKETYLNSGVVIYSGNGVQIGDRVLIAANCTIAPVNHEYRSSQQPILHQRFMPSKGGIVIEDDVWIGAGSVLLDGAHIGQGVVIGACSLVKEKLEPYTIYAGNPLRKIGKRK